MESGNWGPTHFLRRNSRQDILSDRDNQKKNSVPLASRLSLCLFGLPLPPLILDSTSPHISPCLPLPQHPPQPQPRMSALGRMVSGKERKKKNIVPTYPRLADPIGLSGKNWHGTKKAFRPNAGLTSYAKRQEVRKQADAVKELEREMKAEHEAERKVCRSSLFFFFLYKSFSFPWDLVLTVSPARALSPFRLVSP